jgi:hypothetical protein
MLWVEHDEQLLASSVYEEGCAIAILVPAVVSIANTAYRRLGLFASFEASTSVIPLGTMLMRTVDYGGAISGTGR